MFEEMELNPAFGLALPKMVAAEGLEIVEVDSRIHLAHGGSLMARMMGTSTSALADKYVATGEASESDIDRCIEKTNDDQFWTVYYSTVSVIATDLRRIGERRISFSNIQFISATQRFT